MTIFLIGFMGAGKTTLGKKLAGKLGFSFVDLDAVVEKNEARYIRDIITESGESYFRQKESETLRQLDLIDKVISTGGGTPCFHDNMIWMKEHGTTVFVNANEGVIYSRLVNTNRENRPLLKGLDDEGLKQFIHTKLEERKPFYCMAEIVYEPIRTPMEDLISNLIRLS